MFKLWFISWSGRFTNHHQCSWILLSKVHLIIFKNFGLYAMPTGGQKTKVDSFLLAWILARLQDAVVSNKISNNTLSDGLRSIHLLQKTFHPYNKRIAEVSHIFLFIPSSTISSTRLGIREQAFASDSCHIHV